ncbi:MAG: flavodoxin domain-containing protein [Neisseriaceae bacterium]|nr:flavodoxin domain-containing protein [Neisseriaceae bacterium]MBR5674856.1 flavodoxin domain-containing protein [Neisseriaceae bacterium]MBR5939971.1 flavodoxin domain-containing protein [Neisseriaceae bacterium]
MSTAIVFGSNDGDSQVVAQHIAESLNAPLLNATDLTADFLAQHNKLIFVASTHKVGEVQKDFQAKLPLIAEADWTEKTLALVGLGNAAKHPDTFNSGLVDFLPVTKGAKLVGAYPNQGYTFDYSAAFINGKFIGLALDYKNDNNWKNKTNAWLDEVKQYF